MQDHWDAAAEAAYEALVPTTANSGSREARGPAAAGWPGTVAARRRRSEPQALD